MVGTCLFPSILYTVSTAKYTLFYGLPGSEREALAGLYISKVYNGSGECLLTLLEHAEPNMLYLHWMWHYKYLYLVIYMKIMHMG